jgi:hypothetical protein
VSDPHTNGGLSVTLKQEGSTGVWMVFHGTPDGIHQDIVRAFQLDPETYAEWALSDLVNEAHRIHRGVGNVAQILGGKPMKAEDTSPPFNTDKPADEVNPLIGLIEAVESIAELQTLYKRNAAEFKANPDLTEVWKAKGKALKEAGK